MRRHEGYIGREGTQGTTLISILRDCSKAESLDRVDEADYVDVYHDDKLFFVGTLVPLPATALLFVHPLCAFCG